MFSLIDKLTDINSSLLKVVLLLLILLVNEPKAFSLNSSHAILNIDIYELYCLPKTFYNTLEYKMKL